MPSHQIGGYRLDRVLGTGSFATVWLAFDEQLAAPVAIKILADNWARHPEIRRRFIDEARLLRRIDDDRVVRVYSVGDLPDGRPYFVMAWADRGTLLDRIQARPEPRHWPLADALSVAAGIAQSLAVVHAFGIVHRDVKPSNVLFRSLALHQRGHGADERIVLGDFGLAKDLVGGGGFTVAGGTPAYMAPEQARTSPTLDVRADLFATAAVLYELLTGHPAYAADTLESARDGTRSRPQPLAATRPELPGAVQQLLDRGLDPDPAGRFATATELTANLRLLRDRATGKVAASPIVPGGAEGSGWDAVRLPDDRWAPALAPGTPAPAWGPPVASPPTYGTPRPPDAALPPPPPAPPPPAPSGSSVEWASRDSAAAVTPVVAVRALIGQARSVLGAHDPAWNAAAAHLEAPLRLVLVGGGTPAEPADPAEVADTVRRTGPAGIAVHLAPAPGHGAGVGADALVFLGTPATRELRQAAIPGATHRSSGPLSVAHVVDGALVPGGARPAPDPGGARGDAGPHEAGDGTPPGGAGMPAQVAAWVVAQREAWWDAARAARALDTVDTALAVVGDAPGAERLRSQAELIRLAHPTLGEVGILADEAAGRLRLPDTLLAELRQVLGGRTPATRAGAGADATPAEIRTLGADGAARWRALSNSGRIPFAARGAAGVVARAYDRLATGTA